MNEKSHDLNHQKVNANFLLFCFCYIIVTIKLMYYALIDSKVLVMFML